MSQDILDSLPSDNSQANAEALRDHSEANPKLDPTHLDIDDLDGLPSDPAAAKMHADDDGIGEVEKELQSVGDADAHDTTTTQRGADDSPGSLDQLRREAQALGFSPEDVQSLDATRLGALVDVQRQFALQGGWQNPNPQPAWPQAPWGGPTQPWTQQPGQPMPYQQAPPGAPGVQPQNPQQPDPLDPKTYLDPAVYDEKLVDYLGKMHNAYQQQMQAQQAQLAAVAQQMQMERAMMAQQQAMLHAQAKSRELDQWIESKGEAYSWLLGKGDVQPNSPYARTRDAIFRAAAQMEAQAMAVGVPVDPAWVKEQAAKRVLGNQWDVSTQQAAREPAARRQRQAVARANGHVPSNKPGRERAGDYAEQFFRERGMA